MVKNDCCYDLLDAHIQSKEGVICCVCCVYGAALFFCWHWPDLTFSKTVSLFCWGHNLWSKVLNNFNLSSPSVSNLIFRFCCWFFLLIEHVTMLVSPLFYELQSVISIKETYFSFMGMKFCNICPIVQSAIKIKHLVKH